MSRKPSEPTQAPRATETPMVTPTEDSQHPHIPADNAAGPQIPERDLTLTRKDAKAAAPASESVGGEEDPGAGLEFLVKRDDFHDDSDKPHPAGRERADHRKVQD